MSFVESLQMIDNACLLMMSTLNFEIIYRSVLFVQFGQMLGDATTVKVNFIGLALSTVSCESCKSLIAILTSFCDF